MQAVWPRDQRLRLRQYCLDIDADGFHILLAGCESIVDACFTQVQVSVAAASLRADGIVRPISHKFALSANHLMKIKPAAYSFKRDKNRNYKRLHYSRVSRQAPRQEQPGGTQHQLHLQASVST